jgi:hypothetical protein
MQHEQHTDHPQSVPEDFDAFIGACERLRHRQVIVKIPDYSSGFAMASFAGTVTDVRVEDDRAELALDDGTNWLAIFADMIDKLETDGDDIYITYAAGDVEILRRR